MMPAKDEEWKGNVFFVSVLEDNMAIFFSSLLGICFQSFDLVYWDFKLDLQMTFFVRHFGLKKDFSTFFQLFLP